MNWYMLNALSFNALNYILAAIGILLGAFALPLLAQFILKRKYVQLHEWWYSSADKYADKLKDDSGYCPDPKASGLDGALGVWVRDTKRSYGRNLLTAERHERAVELGILSEQSSVPTLSEKDVEDKYSKKVSIPARLVCAFALGAACLFSVASPDYTNVAFLPFLFVLWLLALCDQTSHILPTSLCCLEYPLVAVILFVSSAAPPLPSALFAGVAMMGVILITNKVFTFLGSPNAIGKGDMLLLPACALALGFTFPGFLALCVLSFSMLLAVCVAKIVRKGKFGLRDSLPMGMYIALGVTVGVIASVLQCAAFL